MLWPVDALVASPPCRRASRAWRGPNDTAALVAHARTMCAVIRRARPRAVVIEQSDGLRTHRPHAYAIMCALFDELGYRLLHASRDAHVHYDAPHFRRRVLWVGWRIGDS